jgi:DNA-binding response OmpR family regulator
MHGTISVKSEPGKSTIFTLHIPLGKDHLKESEYKLSEFRKELETKTPGSTELPEIKSEDRPGDDRQEAVEADFPLILVVEDNTDIRMMIAENLEHEFIVLEAGDGSAGLKLAIDHMPELVITDLMMPRMDGIEMCTHLKSDLRTSHIPVIMLTAKAALEDKLQGLETGADDYIPKPFEIKEVIARTKNLIEQRRMLREKFSREISVAPRDIVITPVDEKFLQKAIDVVEARMDDNQFNVTEFCKEMNMSQSTIFRKLDALTNLSPIGFIRSIRLKRAASLLQQQFGNVSEVALEVGFNNPSYFSRMFSKYYEISPSEYAKSFLSKTVGGENA